MRATGENTTDLVGSLIGNYEVISLLGQGGMGDVYLGRHPLLGREVAIKVLAAELCADPSKILRFQQEAQAVCRIGHPDIVGVLDFGTLPDGRSHYVMERLQGQSLRDHLKERGALPPDEVLRIATPVLKALGAAHEHGVVHRDIKPENIFLQVVPGSAPQARLLDFGIAKLLETGGEEPLLTTNTGIVLGTPLYLSPEQAAGGGRDIGPFTDIYCMGVLLFEMLAGRPPFIGEGIGEVLVQHLQAPPPCIRELMPQLDQQLDSVLRTALAKSPQARYQTADSLLAALAAAVLGVPAAVPGALQSPQGSATLRLADSAPVPIPEALLPAQATRPEPPAPRKRGGLLWLAVAVALLLGLVGGYVITRTGGGRPRRASGDRAKDAMARPPAMRRLPSRTGPRRHAPRIVARHGGVTFIETKGKSSYLRPRFDPKRFDALGFLLKAMALAKKWRPDAVLVDLTIPGVFPDGHVDLTVTEDAEAQYQFRSAAESKRDLTKPRNVEQDIPCLFNVDVKAHRIETYVSTSTHCQELPLPGNRCTLGQAWQIALQRGAPRGNVVAKMVLEPGKWYLDFGSTSMTIPDRCP